MTLLSAFHILMSSLTIFIPSQEACFICKGPDGASAVMKMTSASQEAMWASVEKADVNK